MDRSGGSIRRRCAFPRPGRGRYRAHDRLLPTAGQLDEFPNSWAAIAALGPSALLMCLTSAFRGFFQGQGNMRPTSVSQVLEAICKLVVGLGLAWFIMKQKNDTALAAGGAILGVTSGRLIATLYMYGAYSRARREMPGEYRRRLLLRPDGQAAPGHCNSHYHRLCGPADHHAGGRQGGDVPADWASRLYPGGKRTHSRGVYNFAQTIFNLPYAFVSPISISILPAITAHPAQCRGPAGRRSRPFASWVSLPCPAL